MLKLCCIPLNLYQHDRLYVVDLKVTLCTLSVPLSSFSCLGFLQFVYHLPKYIHPSFNDNFLCFTLFIYLRI